MGVDINGWHDLACRDWSFEDPDTPLQDPQLIDGGLQGVLVQLDSGRWIGGPQASLAPHGRSGAWGEVGLPERRKSVRSLLDALKDEAETQSHFLFWAPVEALTAGAQNYFLTIPDSVSYDESVRERLLGALRGQKRPKAALLWRSVACFLGAMETGQIPSDRDGFRVRILTHVSDGLEEQILTLRRVQGQSGHYAPERQGYGQTFGPELGLKALFESAEKDVLLSDQTLLEGRCDPTSMAFQLLSGRMKPGDVEILRRANGTWVEISAPKIEPFNSLSLPAGLEGHSVEPADMTLLSTPLGASFADTLADVVETYWGRLEMLSWDAAARGALKAGLLVESGLPHFLDRLDPVRLCLLKTEGAEFVDLIPERETVPANHTYKSKPITGPVWGSGKTTIEFYIQKGDTKVRHWTATTETPPSDDTSVEIHLSQKPAQGWAKIQIVSSTWEDLRRKPIDIDWLSLPEDQRSPEEIIEELDKDFYRPQIPNRILEPSHIDLWTNDAFRSGILDAVSQFEQRGPEALESLSKAIRRRLNPPLYSTVYLPIGTDGELPELLSADDTLRFKNVVQAIEHEVICVAQKSRNRLKNNNHLLCLGWATGQCSDRVQDAFLNAIRAEIEGEDHPLLSAHASARTIVRGAARIMTSTEKLHSLFSLLVKRNQNADTRGALCDALSRRKFAPQSLSRQLAGKIAQDTAENIDRLIEKKSFEVDLKYTLLILTGLLRYREVEPWFLTPDNPGHGREIQKKLEKLRISVFRHRKRIGQGDLKVEIIDSLLEYIEGTGGDPNLLRMLEEIT
ncbi:hypothetical protein [uncultured Roseibium sp.]|uniref:hypothetical protein n=1 Tax=uncultured Roseibium sp. TaxID=1936171 RepID=UPI0026076658|nr:hypothetical protein [uncultured Roseibium sp.]